ncbi:sel1 repeat family protein [Helicobacter pylori]|uniref:sel1 repeat family protein n=1 Tax=Helicobacter pylori TaxID=210 RepID=UPI002FCC0500
MFSGGLMAERDSKELIFSGITIYTDKNFTRAKKYFDKACQLNNVKGCYALATLYNESVAKDEKQMTENLKKACGLGLKEACGILKKQK